MGTRSAKALRRMHVPKFWAIYATAQRAPRGDALMPAGAVHKFDYFLSRRGSVAAVAREVENVLATKNYKVFVQDYDIPLGTSFIEAMHEAIKNSRDLIILLTRDYETSPYTRAEFTSFEAQRLQDPQGRRIVVLRCEDAPLAGLLADRVYQDLVGVTDSEERRDRIIDAVEAPFAGDQAAAEAFRGCAAARCGLHRARGRARPARRHLRSGKTRRGNAGCRARGGAGLGWSG